MFGFNLNKNMYKINLMVDSLEYGKIHYLYIELIKLCI